MQLFFRGQQHGSRARTPHDENVASQGSQSPVNTKSSSLVLLGSQLGGGGGGRVPLTVDA